MDQDTLRIVLREAVRETVTEVLQTVLELDRTAFLQAHGGRRNGYYPRKLETTFGQVDLRVPRDREGRYYPTFLRPYTRRPGGRGGSGGGSLCCRGQPAQGG